MRFPHPDSNALLVSASHDDRPPAGRLRLPAADSRPESGGPRGARARLRRGRREHPGTGPHSRSAGSGHAWSATSASEDIIDVYALDLCNVDGPPDSRLDGLLYRGPCTRWSLSCEPRAGPRGRHAAAGPRPSASSGRRWGSSARATIGGMPVVYTKCARPTATSSTAPGFQEWNDPTVITDARAFQRAAMKVGYTFNWLYTDDRDIAYINTGSNPVRPEKVNGLLPIRWSPATEWKGFDPDTNIAAYAFQCPAPRGHGNRSHLGQLEEIAGPPLLAAARRTRRCALQSRLLLDRLGLAARGVRRKMTLGQVVDAAEDAATVDLRGDKMLPWALKALGTPVAPAQADAAAKLRAWVRALSATASIVIATATTSTRTPSGSSTCAWATDAAQGGLRPRWATRSSRPTTGTSQARPPEHLRITGALPPRLRLGGRLVQGYIQKDLRDVLRPKKVRGKWHVKWCGGGKLVALPRGAAVVTARGAGDGPGEALRGPDAHAGAAAASWTSRRASTRCASGRWEP